MKEARITCKTRTVKIADLDIDMVRGEVVFIPVETASASTDLRVMQGAKAVEVFYVQRSQETRQHAPSAPPGRGTPPKKRKAIVTVKGHEIDEDALADKLMERLMPFVGQRVSGDVMERMQATLDDSMQQIRQALQGTVGVRPGVSPGTMVDAPEIAFIPEGIVGAVEGTVEVQEAESEGSGGVDDAAAALKAARKQKKETP